MDTELERDLQKHFGPWPNEKCWGIKEVRPIPVKTKLSWTGKYYRITAEPMSMTYKTAEHLDMDHRHQDIGVSLSSYDYENGEAVFIADTLEAVKQWAEQYSDIITLKPY